MYLSYMYDVGLVGFVSLGIAAWVQLDSSNERIPKPRGLVFPDIRFYRYPEKPDK
jgi:hypothetical protein